MDTLERIIKEIYNKFKFPERMIMTVHDKSVYDNSTPCHICNEELGKDKVRDHYHLSGKFRGAAHEVCNLKYKVSTFSQLYFTNTWFQSSSQLYFTICLAMRVNYLLKHWEIAKEIFLAY